MKKLLNTLYITNEKSYLRLDGENIVIEVGDHILGKVPLLNFDSIVYFGYLGASPALLGYLAENNIPISFLTPYGKFLARINNEYHGNVILRKQQYLISDKRESIFYARNMIFGKIANQKFVLEKFAREYKNVLNTDEIVKTSKILNSYLDKVLECNNKETLRGYEGYCAEKYFNVLDCLILKNKDIFYINNRNKRPPKDNVNAMLSFLYTLLIHDCASALETVGLDPYCGFLHTDIPGRTSLACDLVEELRPVFVDRFVISLINKQIIKEQHFEQKSGQGVYFTEEGKKLILKEWQNRKQNEIKHPFLDENIKYGLIPYAQALLLSRTIRGDIMEYPPFLWR